MTSHQSPIHQSTNPPITNPPSTNHQSTNHQSPITNHQSTNPPITNHQFTMITRPRKIEFIVIGRGLAAAALADKLVLLGHRVALLVEEPGWQGGIRPAWEGWHTVEGGRGGERETALVAAGAAQLAAWQAEGLPGIQSYSLADAPPLWLLDYDQLLPALGERIAAGTGCWVAEGTRVRGISVIEKAILGAIAEDARYDARQLINAAEDERYRALSRMMRQRDALDLISFTPTQSMIPQASPDGQAAYPNATTFERDNHSPLLEETSTKGGWRIRGVAGWPLLGLGVVAGSEDW